MSDKIRIAYRENVDHFVESQQNQAHPGSLLSPKGQRWFFGILIGGTLIFALGKQYHEGTSVPILVMGCIGVLAIMAFWLWFFKKIGYYKPNQPYQKYRWTPKDRERLQEKYRKSAGCDETIAVAEFDDDGFVLGPEGQAGHNYPWATIIRAVERPTGLFIYIRRSVYFWFPKTAFLSENDYRRLLNIVSLKVPVFQRFRMAYIALGSNLGESRDNIGRAMGRLEEFSDGPLQKSSLIETMPVDCPPGSPNFVNGVVGLVLEKDETPESLLSKLKEIEKEFGRMPKKALNEPRPLDLDLIAFGNEIRNTKQLVLPHPRAHLRRFVLQPLSEITPDLVLPGQAKSVAKLLAELLAGES